MFWVSSSKKGWLMKLEGHWSNSKGHILISESIISSDPIIICRSRDFFFFTKGIFRGKRWDILLRNDLHINSLKVLTPITYEWCPVFPIHKYLLVKPKNCIYYDFAALVSGGIHKVCSPISQKKNIYEYEKVNNARKEPGV